MYRFRITFSSDVTKHYSPNPTDTTVSMIVVAETFRQAESQAFERLEELVLYPKAFEIVSVQRIEED